MFYVQQEHEKASQESLSDRALALRAQKVTTLSQELSSMAGGDNDSDDDNGDHRHSGGEITCTSWSTASSEQQFSTTLHSLGSPFALPLRPPRR